MRKKIKIARWLTNKIAEYDVTNDFWINQATDVKTPFSAFSAAVYLPGQDIAIVGGLDDSVPNKPSFRSSVTLI